MPGQPPSDTPRKVLVNNYARTTLADSLHYTEYVLTVNDSSGFPVPAVGECFYATIVGLTHGAEEIVKVVAVNANTWTVIRGRDGTTAYEHGFVAGDRVEMWLNAGILNDIRDEISNKPVEGSRIVDASVVTAKVQDAAITATKLATALDLSGKTLTMPSTSMPKIMADTTGAPDYVGQIGLVSGIAYVATGIVAGNWTLLDPKKSQSLESLWTSNNDLFPEKSNADPMDFVLIEDVNDYYKKKKTRAAHFTNRTTVAYAKSNFSLIQSGTAIYISFFDLMLHSVDTWWRKLLAFSSLQINVNTTGLNGIDVGTKSSRTYDIYVVANDTGGIGGLMVINGNSPVYPSGYIYAVKVGLAFIQPDGNLRESFTKGNDTHFSAPYTVYTGSVSSAYNEFVLPEGIPWNAQDLFVEAGTTDTTELTLEFCPRALATCKTIMANYCPNSYSDRTGMRNSVCERVFYGGAVSTYNGKFYLKSARVGGAASPNQSFAITGYSVNEVA